MKRQFSLRERILMMVLALLLLICFYYVLVEKPVQDTLLDASQRRSEAESQLTVASAQLQKMNQMQSALDQLEQSAQADVPDYDNAKNVMDLMNGAMAMTEEYNLTFQPVTTEGAIVSRSIQMNFRCDDYDTAKDVLQTLLDSNYRCRITAMSVTATDGGNIRRQEVTVDASVTFYEFNQRSLDSAPQEEPDASEPDEGPQ